ncbi:MAG: trypsin-like peptidase domain-containing protein [Nitrospinaceae bacterium]
MKIRFPTGLLRYWYVFFFLFFFGNGTAFATHAGIEILEEMQHALISLAQQVLPSVVSISPYVPPSPSIRRRDSRDRARPANAGAGVIIDGEKGLVVTNHHVVRKASKVQVTLLGGKQVVGDVLWTDEDTDLAIVKIESDKPLVSAKFGDSSQLKVGQFVVAVGNPYGLNDTLTFGIVSGLNRENINLSRYEDFIQTDASINPGNSGGPLLNIKGEIVGINTAIINYAQNIGFAIPSNMVKKIVSQFLQFGEVRRGWLGVGIESVTRELAEQAHSKEGEGVWVNSVFEGDPAHQAGIQVGDIILKIGGSSVNSPSGMIRLIGAISPGQTVQLDILRGGRKQAISVTLGKHKKRSQRVSLPPSPGYPPLGIEVQDLPVGPNRVPGEGAEQGVRVSKVYPESPAASKGLVSGDLIIAINGETVTTREEYEAIIQEISTGQPVFLLILRNDEKIHLALVRED